MTKSELQRLRSLREKKHREALGLFVVEGEKVISELLAARFPFLEIYATSPDALARPPSASPAPAPHPARPPASLQPDSAPPAPPPRPQLISADEMARISHFPTPSTAFAVGRITRPPLAPADLARGLTLALDGLQDAGNVGTLLRLADWFAFARVLLSPDCADLFHQKVINASMGSFARVPAHTVDLAPTFNALRAHASAADVPILGCDLSGTDVHRLPPLPHAIVVIGSEGRGLSPAVKATLDTTITIPRYGHAESLNAAAAAAIVCAQLRHALRPPV